MHGIGGRTIAEAQSNMSMAEFGVWMSFRARYGSLHVGRRLERAQASTSAILANANSKGGYTAYDFLHEDEPEISLDQAMQSWG